VATLQKDILATIEHMELASAKDGGKPAVTESAYHTSSGIRASYASRMQATIPWTTELLERHADLRTKFGVTIEDLGKAKGVMVHVTALWNRLMGLPGTPTLDIARSDAKVAAHLPGSGLDDDDLARMLAFAGWRQTVEAGLPHMATKQAELAALDLDHLVGLATALELAKALKPANRRAARAWKKDKKKGSPDRSVGRFRPLGPVAAGSIRPGRGERGR